MKTRILILLSLLFWLAAAVLGADIAIYGDTQKNDRVHAQIAAEIASHHPSAVFHLGDLTQKGSSQKHYDRFWQLSAPIAELCTIHPARGNHDVSEALFLANFPQLNGRTNYTVELDSLLFVILDSNRDLGPRSEQSAWLRGVLEDSTLPKLVLLHHPVFSGGEHGDELGLGLWLPHLLNTYGVAAVFSGHDHHYERSQYAGITYIVTGGAGGVLREPDRPNLYSLFRAKEHHYLILSRSGKTLSVQAFGLEGLALDSFTIPLP